MELGELLEDLHHPVERIIVGELLVDVLLGEDLVRVKLAVFEESENSVAPVYLTICEKSAGL